MDKIFETSSIFHVKLHTTENVIRQGFSASIDKA